MVSQISLFKGGIYELYNDADSKPLYARTEGKELTIFDDEGRMEMVFETS